MDKSRKIFSNTHYSTWILFGIILVGIFLRTYNFHNWLYFAKDQARDSFIVESVLKGEAPIPFLGPKMGNSGYKLGPLFYYIKMASGKIFGVGPDKMAYPELFLSILTIPLFYFFLKRCFKNNLSLALTGLFSISFFAVRYSRFAWNLNMIPFFVLLFLLSLSEFLFGKEKTKWPWVISLGIAVGVNTQLHAILIFLSGPIIFLAFAYVLWKNKQAWKKCAVVILLAIILNSGVIIGETRTDYRNSKNFISAFTDKSDNGQGRLVRDFKLSIACYAQANGYIITSLGEKDNCNFLNKKYYTDNQKIKFFGSFLSFAFVLLGFFLLARGFRLEKDEKKKIFLGVIILYSALFFAVMIPAINGATLRYYIHIFFLPYLFLGIMAEFLAEKFPKKYITPVVVIFILVAAANLFSIKEAVQELSSGNRSRGDTVILGEIEPLSDFIISQSFPQKEAYLEGKYAPSYYWPLNYLTYNKGLILTQIGGKDEIPAGKPLFDINPVKKNVAQEESENKKSMTAGNIFIEKKTN
jgi:4-amino-4-deoxy-L-arabinose transferase-like glycosyltransferase